MKNVTETPCPNDHPWVVPRLISYRKGHSTEQATLQCRACFKYYDVEYNVDTRANGGYVATLTVDGPRVQKEKA